MYCIVLYIGNHIDRYSRVGMALNRKLQAIYVHFFAFQALLTRNIQSMQRHVCMYIKGKVIHLTAPLVLI